MWVQIPLHSLKLGLLSSRNGDVKCLLCTIDVFNKYACVKPWTDKKAQTVFDGFIGIISECKPNELYVDQGK